MITQLKNNFMHISFFTIVWVMLLITVANLNMTVTITYFWNLIAIGAIVGIVFGVIYPYVWNYSTSKAPINIVICTILNVCMQFATVYLFSQDMFLFIKPYALGIIAITFIGHLIAFYFYKKVQNQKMADELNQLKK